MNFSKIRLEGVRGVGTIALNLSPEKRVHTFIAENGVGKTKLLESLFQTFLGSHQLLKTITNQGYSFELFVLATAKIDKIDFIFPKDDFNYQNIFNNAYQHNLPIVYIASQNRGFIKHQEQAIQAIGTFSDRRGRYIDSLFQGMGQNFSNLNMENDIEQWFITRAQSSNTYQQQEDNRVIELHAVLELLHKLDTRINAQFLEITGDNRVFIKIKDNKRQLSQLSTGFASVLKIIQSIISGYGNFTNERNLQQVKGIVLIDEIESHLHLSWQAKIIPLLKELFPNTTFYITTHSSIVLTQLEEGEAYKLNRENDGIVHSSPIIAPNKAALIDVLKDAFDIDLNQMKRDSMSAKQQQDAKKKLLDFLIQEAI
jgi:predicted ATP-binding protein involved in virulence